LGRALALPKPLPFQILLERHRDAAIWRAEGKRQILPLPLGDHALVDLLVAVGRHYFADNFLGHRALRLGQAGPHPTGSF